MARGRRINQTSALRHLVDLLRVEGLSGREAAVSRVVRDKLLRAGCDPSWMMTDRAHLRIGQGYETGNLVVHLPGTRRGPRLLFSGHLDTVPLCRGAVPVRRGRRIQARNRTALGADNRTAVACLVHLAEHLLKWSPPHPPLVLLFTVGEECGLWGVRYVLKRDLKSPVMGFNVDGGSPAEAVIGATGADRWAARVHGVSAHAGVRPEDGVSAALIAAKAIADIEAKGYFGKVQVGRHRGTSNVGSIRGGEVTNQVTDFVEVRGECRSHDPRFLVRLTQAHRRAFERAARQVCNSRGQSGRVRFEACRDYEAFRLEPGAEVVRAASAAIEGLGHAPVLRTINGGLDANYLNARGIPTVTLGAGQHGAHTVDEYVDLDEYLDGCRLAVALATEGSAHAQ